MGIETSEPLGELPDTLSHEYYPHIDDILEVVKRFNLPQSQSEAFMKTIKALRADSEKRMK